MTRIPVLLALSSLLLAACASTRNDEATTMSPSTATATPRFAIAIHGGAGVIDRNGPEADRLAYTASLENALREGRDRLSRGDSALDTVEAIVRMLEDDPLFNAGKGAVFTEDGRHELDASIMDGSTLSCGAVAGVRTVKNPISLARLVMEKTPHVLLMGDGAEQFAASVGVELVDPTYFDTERRRRGLEEFLKKRKQKEDAAPPKSRSTVGCVALDSRGNLAAATSTGGMTGKRFGRVGDSPIIGAGTYANNETCAVSCTGTGEEYIRHVAAYDVSALMQYSHLSVDRAARTVIFERLKPDDGGLIAVSHTGEIAMPFNTNGMFRAAADSSGRFEVLIWEK
jgi:L-asparaginase / beta-aspartyl-peptidase